MMRKTRFFALLALLVVLCGLGLLLTLTGRRGNAEATTAQGESAQPRPATGSAAPAKRSPRPPRDATKRAPRGTGDPIVAAAREASRQPSAKPADSQTKPVPSADADGLQAAQSEAATAEAIRKVEAWEAMIDEVAELATKPTVERATQIRDMFMGLNKADQMNAITTALHLLPDEQFPLLYTLLFDKTQEFELLDEIFSDALNRPEEIKVPLMKLLMQDKEHPLSNEAGRILDATGALDAEEEDNS
jgi:hypothetical protein